MTDMDKMMIEKVARAMAADQSLRHYELDSGSWEAQTDYGREEWLHAARAAISAYNDRLREALGAINEARVHLSDLTGKGLGSVDSADEVLASVSLSPLPQGDG